MSSIPTPAALQHRLQFEALVADLSARFVNLPTDQVDRASGAKGRKHVTERDEHGCFGSRLSVSSEAGSPSCIQYVEDWSSEEDLREQVGSDRFPRLLAVMEEALVPPQILFDLPGGTRGLDYVWEIRREEARRQGRRSNAEDS